MAAKELVVLAKPKYLTLLEQQQQQQQQTHQKQRLPEMVNAETQTNVIEKNNVSEPVDIMRVVRTKPGIVPGLRGLRGNKQPTKKKKKTKRTSINWISY